MRFVKAPEGYITVPEEVASSLSSVILGKPNKTSRS